MLQQPLLCHIETVGMCDEEHREAVCMLTDLLLNIQAFVTET